MSLNPFRHIQRNNFNCLSSNGLLVLLDAAQHNQYLGSWLTQKCAPDGRRWFRNRCYRCNRNGHLFRIEWSPLYFPIISRWFRKLQKSWSLQIKSKDGNDNLIYHFNSILCKLRSLFKSMRVKHYSFSPSRMVHNSLHARHLLHGTHWYWQNCSYEHRQDKLRNVLSNINASHSPLPGLANCSSFQDGNFRNRFGLFYYQFFDILFIDCFDL